MTMLSDSPSIDPLIPSDDEIKSAGPLLKSRKFWVAVADVVFSAVLFFSAKYLAPTVVEDIKFVIGAIQVPVALLIGSMTVQNVVAMRANADLKQASTYAALSVVENINNK